jgi:predicted phosphoribosyltransferase
MYANRIEAGLLLAKELEKFKKDPVVILAVPRGGVPVGYVIASHLHAALDIILIKKIGHPQHKEYAIGAVSLTGSIVTDEEGVPPSYIESEIQLLRAKLAEMFAKYKGVKPPEPLTGKTVILVDDGIATGNTLAIGISFIKRSQPAKIVIAVPVAARQAVEKLSAAADEIICPLLPSTFYGVGRFYEDFTQVSDEEVMEYLNMTNQ